MPSASSYFIEPDQCICLCSCRGQGEALNIDRRDIYARLYACIPELALLPLQPDEGSLHELLSQGMAATT